MLGGFLDAGHQFVQVEGLQQIIRSACFHGLDRELDIRIGGQHDDAKVGLDDFDIFQELNTILFRQVEVEHGNIKVLVLHALDGLLRMFEPDTLIPVPGEDLTDQLEDIPLIIHDQDAGTGIRNGRLTGPGQNIVNGQNQVALSDGAVLFALFADHSPNRAHRGLAAGGIEFRAAQPFGQDGELGQVNTRGQRLALGMDSQNLQSAVHVRIGDLDDLIEATGTEKGLVDRVRPISRGQDEHALEGLHTVHLSQELGHHAVRERRIRGLASPRSNRIDLIKEDDAGSGLACLSEHLPDRLFRITDVLRDQRGALD